MKKTLPFALSLIALSTFSMAEDVANTEVLPVQFETVFSQSMNDPNVIIYHADKAFRDGRYAESLRWMLEASKYDHPAAIENVKHMIKHNFGTVDNRESVVGFLKYHAEDKGDVKGDLFASMYLAEYYSGDTCVWFAQDKKSDCQLEKTSDPMANIDFRQSYYYYENAAERGDSKALYTTAMMDILGVGVPRNVPLGIKRLVLLSEKGSVAASNLVGQIYQQGYWVPQDRNAASNWFAKPVEMGIPTAVLDLAKNHEAGVVTKDEEASIKKALSLYDGLVKGVLASKSQRAEALYRSGLIYENNPLFKDEAKAAQMMSTAINFGSTEPNEFSLKALLWSGQKLEEVSLSKAVTVYKRALVMLEKLPLDQQQRNSVVLQKIAFAYARGQEGDLIRDQRLYSEFMNKHHQILSKTYMKPAIDTSFAGYSVFNFPG